MILKDEEIAFIVRNHGHIQEKKVWDMAREIEVLREMERWFAPQSHQTDAILALAKYQALKEAP